LYGPLQSHCSHVAKSGDWKPFEDPVVPVIAGQIDDGLAAFRRHIHAPQRLCRKPIHGFPPAEVGTIAQNYKLPLATGPAHLNRSIAHTASHVGQIVYLARHFAGDTWTSLTIPKGASANIKGEFKK